MRHKQFLIFISLAFIIPINIHSQDKETGIFTRIKHKNKSEFHDYAFIGLSLSINNPTFYSQPFIDKLNEGLIKETNKMIFATNISYRRLQFDINYFQNNYTSSLSEFNMTYDGFEGFLSYRIQLINYLHIDPYIGIGYQESQIANSESILKVSQPLWKIGMNPFFSIPNSDNQIIYFIVEYKQSFNYSSNYSVKDFSYGVGYAWILGYD